ncbi:hypothetical protein APR08_004101 [Nocardia amikacinitolerans]|nr:hypothetical protein [Nocardia amikacinitolerans]
MTGFQPEPDNPLSGLAGEPQVEVGDPWWLLVVLCRFRTLARLVLRGFQPSDLRASRAWPGPATTVVLVGAGSHLGRVSRSARSARVSTATRTCARSSPTAADRTRERLSLVIYGAVFDGDSERVISGEGAMFEWSDHSYRDLLARHAEHCRQRISDIVRTTCNSRISDRQPSRENLPITWVGPYRVPARRLSIAARVLGGRLFGPASGSSASG